MTRKREPIKYAGSITGRWADSSPPEQVLPGTPADELQKARENPTGLQPVCIDFETIERRALAHGSDHGSQEYTAFAWHCGCGARGDTVAGYLEHADTHNPTVKG